MSGVSRFFADKGFNVFVAAPASAAVMVLYSHLWSVLSWQIITAGLLVFVSVWGMVEFLKHERRRGGLFQPSAFEKRNFFVGNWRCDDLRFDPKLVPLVLTLNQDGTAHATNFPHIIGRWECADGVARIHFSDGWRLILRPTPEGVLKFAYDQERRGVLPDTSPTNYSLAEKLPSPLA